MVLLDRCSSKHKRIIASFTCLYPGTYDEAKRKEVEIVELLEKEKAVLDETGVLRNVINETCTEKEPSRSASEEAKQGKRSEETIKKMEEKIDKRYQK